MVFSGCAVRLVTPVFLTLGHLPMFSTVWTSHCVRSKATRPTFIGWNMVGIRTASLPVVGPTIGVVLLVVTAVTMVVRLLVIGMAISMVVTVVDHLRLLVIAQSDWTGTVGDFFCTSNVTRVSVSGTSPRTVT